MIVIRVELWGDPNGRDSVDLGTIRIANDLSGTEDLGNYEVSVATKGKGTRTFRVEGHRRVGGFWLLAFEVLKKFVHPSVTFSGSGTGRPPSM